MRQTSKVMQALNELICFIAQFLTIRNALYCRVSL